MTLTTADVLDRIRQQLDWRGSQGKGQGHIVLSREEAEFLHRRVIELVRSQDELVALKERAQQGG